MERRAVQPERLPPALRIAAPHVDDGHLDLDQAERPGRTIIGDAGVPRFLDSSQASTE